MAKVTRGPGKQPGERWFGEGPVGLIPFGPRRASSQPKQSVESQSDPMAPAVEAYERTMMELLRQSDPMAPAVEAAERALMRMAGPNRAADKKSEDTP